MHTIVIAEAGVNHNGSLDIARDMIIAASDSGADFIKFQTFKAERITTKNAKKADYQINNDRTDSDSQFTMLKNLELPEEWHRNLFNLAIEKGIGFLSSGFDMESIDFLDDLGISLFKIPSGEITNKPLLRHIARKNKPVIISTGMATMEEIKAAIDVFISNGIGSGDITVLHCNTEYPTPMKDVNLTAMLTIKNTLGVKVGYSDHTMGYEVPIAAVALGASVVEKHFTLNRDYPGPDHKASLEPGELKEMVCAIRNIEMAISGTGVKEPSLSEKKNIEIVRKSIVAATHIEKGDYFNDANLTVKRPGTGINPMFWDEIIGKIAFRDFEPDDLIEI